MAADLTDMSDVALFASAREAWALELRRRYDEQGRNRRWLELWDELLRRGRLDLWRQACAEARAERAALDRRNREAV